MSAKEEVIKAAEVFKRFCDERYPYRNCSNCVCYIPICGQFRDLYALRNDMDFLMDEIQKYPDEDF